VTFRGRVSGRPAPPGTTVPQYNDGGGGGGVSLLRGPMAARLMLECSLELLEVARTAPTLEVAALEPVAAEAATGAAADAGTASAAVAETASEVAAAAATLRVAVSELVAPRTGAGGEDAAPVAQVAAVASSERPYESSAAAVEGAVELAGAAAAPLSRLLSSPDWLGELPLQPPPREALRVSWGELLGASGAAAATATATATTTT
ncbi:hypothetical protein Agub_g13794, partial [Astrephomene gubernaculifera]